MGKTIGLRRFVNAAAFTLLLFVSCNLLHASTLPIIGTGGWGCGFYPPGDTGYGTTEDLSFTSQDTQGNPITAYISFGIGHASPPCVPGLQPFSGTVALLVYDEIYGQYTYLGQTYQTVGAGQDGVCFQQGCYISVTASEAGNISISLGYLSAPGTTSYLDLAGTAYIMSSNFGTQPVSRGGVPFNSLYSFGTFSTVPEPAEWSLLICGALLLFAHLKCTPAK